MSLSMLQDLTRILILSPLCMYIGLCTTTQYSILLKGLWMEQTSYTTCKYDSGVIMMSWECKALTMQSEITVASQASAHFYASTHLLTLIVL